MKKDIENRKVEDIGMAIVPNQEDDALWQVYLINLKKEPLKNILINAHGYGIRDNEPVKTTRLRYFYEEIPAESALKIEPIQKSLFDLSHEYWLSFQLDGFMFDKKYIFVSGSIQDELMGHIPIVEEKGILIL